VTDRPILFSAPMVRALLDGTKTQTRRVLKNGWQPVLNAPHDVVKTWFAPPDVPALGVANQWAESGIWAQKNGPQGYNRFLGLAPYRPGDRLWVKETWRTSKVADELRPSQLVGPGYSRIWYEADRDNCDQHGKVRVSIHMPRWASRLTLLVTDVRVQRLQDISEADALAEGAEAVDRQFDHRLSNAHKIDLGGTFSHVLGYERLWNSINGPDAWDRNPWVVAVSFTVEQRNIDA
jgi:hypothetical protein